MCVVGKNYRLQDIQLSKNRVEAATRALSCAGRWKAARAAASFQALLAGRSPLTRRLRRQEPGGEYRARTGDLLVANQALSQLS